MTNLISVIVPVYNVEDYIRLCITSIINQNYRNLEVLVIDDGSTDGSGKICDELALKDNRIRVYHKENGGLSSARNYGMDRAKGNYIAFVDSDDYIDPDMYKKLYDLIRKNDSDLCICSFKKFNKGSIEENVKVIGSRVFDSDEIIKRFFRINTFDPYFSVWCRLYKSELLHEIRFTEGIINEDVDFSYKVFKKIKKCCETNDKLYNYNIGNNSITRDMLSPRDFDIFKAWKNVIEISENEEREFAIFNYKRCYFTLLMKYAMYGSRDFADFSSVKKELVGNLKLNRNNLLDSNCFDDKRKVAINLLCYFLPLIRFAYKFKVLRKVL